MLVQPACQCPCYEPMTSSMVSNTLSYQHVVHDRQQLPHQRLPAVQVWGLAFQLSGTIPWQ